jgi:hypothetical protein
MEAASQSTVATTAPPSDKPTLLLLSLAAEDYFNQQYASLINALNDRTNLKKAKTSVGAIRFLESNIPSAIIVTDHGLTQPANKAVIEKIITYVRAGGLVIVGLHFPQFTNVAAFKSFFRNFGLPWEAADYTSNQFRFNVGCELPKNATPIAISPYRMKALHVKNALPREKIIVPVERQAQAAVVGAKVGEGFVVYAGDVNSGDESDRVILSLCGL